MKPLLIGEAPAPGSHANDPAFSGRSGHRIAELIGGSLFKHFDTINLLEDHQPREQKGSSFDLPRAREVAKGVLVGVEDGRTLVLAGRRVAAAFDVVFLKYLQKTVLKLPGKKRVTVFLLPHPSGVNRWWNDHDNVEKARHLLLTVIGPPYGG